MTRTDLSRVVSLAVCTLVLAAPARGQERPVRVDRIAAIVGDVAIPESRIEERLFLARRQEGFPTDSAQLRVIRMNILNQLVEDELLMQAAARDTAVHVSEEQIQQSVDQRMKQIRDQFSSVQEYEQELRASGLTSPDEHRRLQTDLLRVEMTREALKSYLRQTGKLRPLPPTEAEMRAFFEAQKASGQLGQRPPTVTFRQIVVRPQPDSSAIRAAFVKADSVLKVLKSGADFATVAAEASDDPGSKNNGGSLGWVRRGMLDRTFERVAFRLRPGVLSPVVPTQFGFHIIRVDRVDAAEILVRHILIQPFVSDENRATALSLADSIARQLRAGASFDSLSRLYHDAEEETLLDRVLLERLPPVYAEPLQTAEPGQVIGPITLPAPTGDKYAVVVYEDHTAEGEFTFDELRDQIYDILSEQNGMRRYIDELKTGTYVEVRLGQPDGERLVSSHR